jgi:hypothetical protein
MTAIFVFLVIPGRDEVANPESRAVSAVRTASGFRIAASRRAE